MVFTQYLTHILDSVHDAVIVLGIEASDTYRILMTNAAFHQETGIPKNCIGKTISQVITNESLGKLTKMYQKVRTTKKPHEYAAWYDMPIGHNMYEVKLIPICNAMGECVQIAAVARNATELHHLRELQREAAETLDQVAYNLRMQ